MMTDLTSEFFGSFPALGACRHDIEAAFAALHKAVQGGKKLLVCGNGGSARIRAYRWRTDERLS